MFCVTTRPIHKLVLVVPVEEQMIEDPEDPEDEQRNREKKLACKRAQAATM
jgi:hypothetical protein